MPEPGVELGNWKSQQGYSLSLKFSHGKHKKTPESQSEILKDSSSHRVGTNASNAVVFQQQVETRRSQQGRSPRGLTLRLCGWTWKAGVPTAPICHGGEGHLVGPLPRGGFVK